MEFIGHIFTLLLLQPTFNLLVFLLRIVEAASLPGALGISIVLLTIIIKLILWPFTSKQIKTSRELSVKMAILKPLIADLKKKHKDDKMAFGQAQKELYAEHGINPAGGCLPMIVQILLIWPLYQVISSSLDPQAGLQKINDLIYFPAWKLEHLPDPHFLGINLANKPSEFATVGMYLLLIPVFTGVLQLILAKMMFVTPPKIEKNDTPKEVAKKEEVEDAMAAMQSQMLYMMPVVIAYSAFTFPIALALYWNTLSIASIYQQYQIFGWGGIDDWIKLFKKRFFMPK